MFNFVVAKNGLIFDYFGWDYFFNKIVIIGFIQPLNEIINTTMIEKLVADGKAIGKLDQGVAFLTPDDYSKADLEDKKMFEVSSEISLSECQVADILYPFESKLENIIVIDTFSIDGNPEDCSIVSETFLEDNLMIVKPF